LKIEFSPRRLGVREDKVMAGGTPANPAALEGECEETRIEEGVLLGRAA
jgi:hypothetical protein